ncbi:tyrosine-type recombinase/integrase, partial [uncultured Thioclava sp.]|uniref:tyrosine-type recombinase/integrase n=1 Tax=uncultured Thioclava sp. TaxID=473858 RepID=UPI0025F41CBF
MSEAPPDPHWLPAFLEAQAAEAGSARNTIESYARDLTDFLGFTQAKSLCLADLQRGDIETYLIRCEADGLAKSTRARRLSAIRQMFRFAYEEGWRSDDPAIRISGPGRAQRLPKTLSIDEVEALLEASRDQGRSLRDQIRNRALMELLYATGMRVSELVGLPVAAARGDPRMLLISGKGGKERMVPLSPPAREALADWLRARDTAEEEARVKRRIPPSRFLFPSSGKEGHRTRPGFHRLLTDI